MKRILFLDDDQARHDEFDLLAKGANVKHVWTADECVAALQNDPVYDAVFLDHDLGDFTEDDKEKRAAGNGYEVALFISEDLLLEKMPKNIVIHSWNPPAAERMKQAISKVFPQVKKIEFKFYNKR